MTGQRVSTWREFIRDHRFGLLLLSLVIMILVPALRGAATDDASGLLWGLVLIAAVHAAAASHRVTLLFAGMAVLVFGGRLGTLFRIGSSLREELDTGGFAMSAIFLAMTIWVISRHLQKSEQINTDTVMAALCVYLLTGLMWSNFYAIIYQSDPGAFKFPDYAPLSSGEILPEFTFAYYSFTTLTTLGYGDITPISYSARTLSWLEAVAGVSYMAAVIGFLASQVRK